MSMFMNIRGGGFTHSAPYVPPVVFLPASLFTGGYLGSYYDPSDLSTLWQDIAMTIPVVAHGDPVALLMDLSGNGNHWEQPSPAARPLYQTDGTFHWLYFDGAETIETDLPFLIGSADSHHFVASQMTAGFSDNSAAMTTSFGAIVPGESRVLSFQSSTKAKIGVDYLTLKPTTAAFVPNVYEGLFQAAKIRGVVNGSVVTEHVGATGMNTTSGVTRLGEGVTGLKAKQKIFGGLIINRELTPTENANLVGWLSDKYS